MMIHPQSESDAAIIETQEISSSATAAAMQSRRLLRSEIRMSVPGEFTGGWANLKVGNLASPA